MLENHTIFQHITSGTFCSLFKFFPCPKGAQKKKTVTCKMTALITLKPLNKVCELCSAFSLEGFLFDWFGDIQPKIVRLNLRLGQTHLLIMKNC